MTTPATPEPSVNRDRLAELNELETEALIHGALFWYVGEGAMDGEKYEALLDALGKLFPANSAGVQS